MLHRKKMKLKGNNGNGRKSLTALMEDLVLTEDVVLMEDSVLVVATAKAFGETWHFNSWINLVLIKKIFVN